MHHTSACSDGPQPPKTPTLKLDTNSAAGTPPALLENEDRASLSIVGSQSPATITRSASYTLSLVSASPHGQLASITPLPSPAVSVGGSPLANHASQSLAVNDDGAEIPYSAKYSPARTINLQTAPSNGSICLHKRNRSRSEYIAPGAIKPWQRVAVSGSQTPTTTTAPTLGLQREEFLAEKRGISGDQESSQVTDNTTVAALRSSATIHAVEQSGTQASHERYEARSIRSGKRHLWVSIRELGTGTFSRVMLAAREPVPGPLVEEWLPRISLVAVKICEHGPAGGADEKKIETSLKRELDILKAISHPSLIHLKAVHVSESRLLLVLNYCPGGDLFEVASSRQDVLTAGFVHRVFAELVGAVHYLHQHWIVHRDIKLENVLVNISPIELQQISGYEDYPHSIVTLTDLGLGRFLPRPPESPMLSTRCGSEDYAAPELLMGQEYDGRSVDAWALGVLLYAMIEARLPFDPMPGARRQSPKTHRIARCDWTWVNRANAEGEWDDEKGKGFEGARVCVENLLLRARSRWSVTNLAEDDWVQNGIRVPGGLTQHTVI